MAPLRRSDGPESVAGRQAALAAASAIRYGQRLGDPEVGDPVWPPLRRSGMATASAIRKFTTALAVRWSGICLVVLVLFEFGRPAALAAASAIRWSGICPVVLVLFEFGRPAALAAASAIRYGHRFGDPDVSYRTGRWMVRKLSERTVLVKFGRLAVPLVPWQLDSHGFLRENLR
ncbi:hypothetical protein quinque_008748 [Culex quinquefasciatus]